MRILKKTLWPHCVKLNVEENSDSMYDLEIWLGETLGQFKNRWNCVYHHTRTDFYFRDQEDAMMFTLRWS